MVIMNRLPTAKRVAVVSALVEGCSIRATVRLTGVAKNTIVKLLVQLGDACTKYQDACPHSTFMFHGVGLNAPPGMRLEEKSLKEGLQGILADQRRIGQILEERTQLTNEQVNGLFLEAQTKDATYAIGCGIVHEVRDLQIPVGGPVVSLVFQR